MKPARRPHPVGLSRSAVWLLLGSSVAACSFFGPSLDDYAKTPPMVGGEGGTSGGKAGAGATPGDAGAGLAASGSTNGGSSMGGTGDAGATGELGGSAEAGAGGVPEEPDPPAVKGETVAPNEYKLEQVVSRGLPLTTLFTAYSADEKTVTAENRALPRYMPYDPASSVYWDYLASEISQSRAHAIALPTRGVSSLDANDMTGPGNMNPRRLAQWWSAMGRAGAQFNGTALCVVDTPFLRDVANAFHGTSASTPLDLSVQTDWDDVFWLRAIKPWFDTVPKQAWLDWGGPLIQLGPLTSGMFTNTNNLSGLLTRLSDNFTSAYGSTPRFLVDDTWTKLDVNVLKNPHLFARSPWLDPTTMPQAALTFSFYTIATVVPGAVDPGYYVKGDPHYQDDNYVIPRSTKDAYGNDVLTLLTGLSSQDNASMIMVQGLNDFQHRAGLYASDAEGWSTPHQYLNLLRRFADPKTVTLRLEAENCDRYRDYSDGNSGKVFLRSGDLDVRALSGGGWAVTDTAGGEWIEFDDVDFSSGTYRFIARYATSNGGLGKDVDKRIELVIDGHKLAPVILPETATVQVFDTTSLGEVRLEHGSHRLQLRFMDGFADLDWIFARKLDLRLGLQVQNGNWESAQESGGGEVHSGAAAASIFEEFTFDDLNGGALEDGDSVHIQSYDGLYFTAASNKLVMATKREPGKDETFQVKLLSGDGIAQEGATIAIVAPDGQHYFSDGAGTKLDITGTSIGPAQTFKVHAY